MGIVVALFIVAAGSGLALGVWLGRSRTGEVIRRARGEADGLVGSARRAADTEKREADLRGREEAGAIRLQGERDAARQAGDLERVRQRVAHRQAEVTRRQQAVAERRSVLDARKKAIGAKDAGTKALRHEARSVQQQWRVALEQSAGMPATAIRAQQREAMVEEARSDAAVRLRLMETEASESAGQEARRLMAIASERYAGHYLTERSLFNVALDPQQVQKIGGPDSAILKAIQEATGTTLAFSDSGDGIRIDGPDGVAREGARRALARFLKQSRPVSDPQGLVKHVVGELEREIDALGRRAFDQLKIPRAPGEIVRLVGRLNWRTSYTQNQWKHAVEAAQLASLVASELGLDGRLARRGALLHDIGKSLTPQVEGSHALIGAEIARRLGEDEIVANCIGAHHAEEPCNSPYASLVAGTDAMSGGRPGARREAAMVESYARRVEDMERLAGGFAGVDRVFAMQGGREVRVYVRESEVDDAGVARLSADIAHKISDEVVFPGQVKVTVIREHRAVAVAR